MRLEYESLLQLISDTLSLSSGLGLLSVHSQVLYPTTNLRLIPHTWRIASVRDLRRANANFVTAVALGSKFCTKILL